MSDEDSDSEARGVDALRLLKQGSVPPSSADRVAQAGASTSHATSVPLVPLISPQKRSRSLSQDLNEQTQPSTSQKIETEVAVKGKRTPHSRPSQQRDIRQHSSAPERCFSLAKELRNSKSAPDLTLPALAAIRGLQNGTLQVDRHTRMKIAAAAKRVLEARELKRRSSQERESHTSYPYPPPDPVSPLALKAQNLWDASTQATRATTPPPTQQTLSGSGQCPDRLGQKGDAPGSLGSTAAVASGQSPSSATKGNFHRPALGTVTQGGALLSTSHRPFTVTTGLPRFSPGDGGLVSEEQSHSAMPTMPVSKEVSKQAAPKHTSSKVLNAEDLCKPQTG